MKTLDVIAGILLLIGGLNWGLVGFFNFNLINAIFGEATQISRFIYALVGLGALYDILAYIFSHKAMHHRWCDMLEAKH